MIEYSLTTAMENNFESIPCSVGRNLLYKYSCTMMMLRWLTHLVQVPQFTNLVSAIVYPLAVTYYPTWRLQPLYWVLILCIGLFYFSLGNYEPRLRSLMNSIYLVTVVKTAYIDKYGIDTILEPFLNDVSRLESVSGMYMQSPKHASTSAMYSNFLFFRKRECHSWFKDKNVHLEEHWHLFVQTIQQLIFWEDLNR